MLSRPCSEAQQKGQRTAAFHAGGTRVTEMRPRLCSRAGEAWDPGVTLARPGGGRHLGLPGFCLGALLNVRIRQGFREPLSRLTPGFHENTVRRCEFSSGAISRLRIPAGRSQCGLGQSLSLHGAPEG